MTEQVVEPHSKWWSKIVWLEEERDRLWKLYEDDKYDPDFDGDFSEDVIEPLFEQQGKLEALIVSTPASTPDGAIAKLNMMEKDYLILLGRPREEVLQYDSIVEPRLVRGFDEMRELMSQFYKRA